MRVSWIASALVVMAGSVAAFAAPCVAKIDHRKIDQVHIENIQVKQVNSMKEDWRLDAKKVAQHEVLDAKLATLNFQGSDAIPVKQAKGQDKVQVFTYAEHGVTYEITMKKFDWLLPYSGIWKLMMWTVTDVKTVCK